MRYIVTFIIGLTISFGAVASVQQSCQSGAEFARKVALYRLNGTSKKSVLNEVLKNAETDRQFNALKGIVNTVYDMEYKQVKQPDAVRALYYQSCMERNSTGS